MTISVRIVAGDDLTGVGRFLSSVEAGIDYPLGADRFRIDHGADYFAFFRRLGSVRCVVATSDDAILGAATVVMRSFANGRVGYIGDLKATARQHGIARPILRALLGLSDHQGYGISMNPARGRNRIVDLARRIENIETGPVLHFYSLDASAMHAFMPCLVEHRGDTTFRSLAGLKDLVLASTGKPMPLWHAQFGPNAAPDRAAPIAGGQHMFCTPAGDDLDCSALRAGLRLAGSATILHRRLHGRDWSDILTSDI